MGLFGRHFHALEYCSFYIPFPDKHAEEICRSHQLHRAEGAREGTSSRFILPCGVQSQSLWRLSSLNIHHDFREDGGGEFKAQNNAHAVIKDKTKTHDRAVHGVLHHAVLTAFFVAVKVLGVVLVNRGVIFFQFRPRKIRL